MSSPAGHADAGNGQAHIVDLADFQPQAAGRPVLGGNLRVLDSVPVTLSVNVGQIVTTVGELLALREAEILRVDRAADAPLDLVLNGSVVARGQLVVVDEQFGIRITDVAAQQS